jgi:hypothetical protein
MIADSLKDCLDHVKGAEHIPIGRRVASLSGLSCLITMQGCSVEVGGLGGSLRSTIGPGKITMGGE